MRRSEHRIAGVSDESLNLSLTFGENFLRQHCNRQLAGKLRQLAHATLPTSEAAARRDRFRRGDRIKRGQREHRAARTIKIAGDSVEDINQPLAQTAKFLSADSDSPMTDCRFSSRKLSGENAYFFGRNSRDRRDSLRRELGHHAPDGFHAVSERR